MAHYNDLTHALPGVVNLGGLANLAREMGVDIDGPVPEYPEDGESGLAWRRYSVYHLASALEGSGLDLSVISGNNAALVADHHWQDYARDTAYDIGDVAREGSVNTYVDWERYADAMRIDWREVKVEGGEFEGTWYFRN